MSIKSDETANHLLFEFQIGERVIDWVGDRAVVVRHDFYLSGDVRYVVRYDDSKYGTVGWAGSDLKKAP